MCVAGRCLRGALPSDAGVFCRRKVTCQSRFKPLIDHYNINFIYSQFSDADRTFLQYQLSLSGGLAVISHGKFKVLIKSFLIFRLLINFRNFSSVTSSNRLLDILRNEWNFTINMLFNIFPNCLAFQVPNFFRLLTFKVKPFE